MDEYLPASEFNFTLPPQRNKTTVPKLPTKNWPHAPLHKISERAVYMVTAGTLYKQRFLDTSDKLDMVERGLLRLSQKSGWQLEAWAVLANHYHFVARESAQSAPLSEFLRELHSTTAEEVNWLDGERERTIWYNYWETRLTFQHSYLARLSYVHRNPVKHGLVPMANQYRWCSAAWFERTASPAQVKTIYGFKIDRLKVQDDF